MHTFTTRTLVRCCALVLAGLSPAAMAQDDNADAAWRVMPYIWIPDISTDLETDSVDGGGGTDQFDDLLDDLDGAFLGRVEVQGESIGMFADVLFLGLASETDFNIATTDSDLDALVVDVAVVWSPGDVRYQGWELFGGLRYIDLEYTIGLDPVNPAFANREVDASDSFSDFLGGARYNTRFGDRDRWGFTISGDASVGATEGTFSTTALFSYHVGMGSWQFGYRYLNGELKPNENVVDITLHGPMIGFSFAL